MIPVNSRIVRISALFYGGLALISLLWSAVRGLEITVLGDSPFEGLLLGGGTAVFTVFAGLAVYCALPVMRRLAGELAPHLVDQATRVELVLVAVLSGVGEEVFFRGVLQQEFGLVVAAVAFGLAHIGPDRRYLVWTAWALAAGFLFGALYEVTGALLAPVVAHAAHNGVTLLLWKHLRNRRK